MNIRETAFDETIRTEAIIWLACQTDQIADDLREFFNESFDSIEQLTDVIGVELRSYETEQFEDGSLDDDNIGEILIRMARKGRAGFLVQAATPFPHNFDKESTSYSTYGFGQYTTKWFYTDTLDEAFMARLVEWKEAFIEKQRTLFFKAQPTTPL